MPRIIAFDLDDVICYRTSEQGAVDKYRTCIPIQSMIKIVNEAYDQGNTIMIYTARGMSSFKGNVAMVYENLYELTKNQLKEWGVKYHNLVMGKAHYDILIDDKAINSILINNYSDLGE